MTHERSLFERLREPDAGQPPSIRLDVTRLADSVQANLRHVFNSRHGVVPTRADYGIPDVCDLLHHFPDAIAELRTAMKVAIERFEPRLRRVNVKHVADPLDALSVHFEVTAELITGGERAGVWFATKVHSSGEVSVKG